MKTELFWKKARHFECHARGIVSHTDASTEFGGENQGPTPKELVLQGIAGCSGIDVISTLEKMRLPPTLFKMEIEGTQGETTPKYFVDVCLCYYLEGNIPKEKAIHAVTLSMTKYCGVSFMIAKVCPVRYKIILNGEEISEGQAHF